MIKILFVCMGNICRSPTAHGVFRQRVRDAGLAAQIHIDSAGTHAYHVGNPPDPRSRHTALQRNVDLSDLRARQVNRADFHEYDYILAMDRDNLRDLQALAPAGARAQVQLFLDFAPDRPHREVPDPYYGGPQGFDEVFDLVDAAAAGLLTHLRGTPRG